MSWIKRQMRAIAFATASVEKSSINQRSEELDMNLGHHQKLNHGSVIDNLINGEVTEEVLNLKWRTYKILDAVSKENLVLLGYDEKGDGIYERQDINYMKQKLRNVKLDGSDKLPVEMVVTNNDIPNSILEDSQLGIYTSDEINSYIKADKPINIDRESRPKFELEQYTTKLNVLIINANERLLEFYVSKYPDPHNLKSNFFLQEIRKIKNKNIKSNILEFNSVEFITYKTLGVKDFLNYKYKVINFDKIVEYDGSYVLKFICEVMTSGEYLLEKHRLESLDKRYDNNEPKN